MQGGTWLQLAVAALSGTAVPSVMRFVWRRLSRNPKTEAEARKLNVEADGLVIDRLSAEVERLDRKVDELSKQLETERKECAERMAEMQGDIRQLLQQQTSFGHMGDVPLRGQLRTAFKPDPSDKDEDLIAKLGRVPSRKRRK